MRRAFLIGLASAAIAACTAPSEGSAQRFSGTWDWHFETSAFLADDGDGPYWLAAGENVWAQLNTPFAERNVGPWGRLHIVVEGTLSAPGQYGHLGAYERELRVTRVIETRLISTREGSVR